LLLNVTISGEATQKTFAHCLKNKKLVSAEGIEPSTY
jgi:hypothetical protein